MIDYIPIRDLMAGLGSNPPKIIAMLYAYLDETGLNPTANRLTVAGLVGRMSDWRDFEPRWTRCLPNGEMFHATHCIRGRPPYAGMSERARFGLYGRLSSVIARRPFQIVSASVDLEAWRNKRRDAQFEARYPSAYSFCFDLCLLNINAMGEREKERIDVTYALHQQYGPRSAEVAQSFVASERYSKWIVRCATARPQQVIHLQAADMICYEIYSQNQETNFDIDPAQRAINKLYPAGAIGLYHDEESLDEVIRRGPTGFIR